MLGCGILLTLTLGFFVIHRVIRVTLRPIDELTRQMKDRAGHQLDSALALPRKLPVELTGLAESFDTLLARVAAIRERERDFIRHAAHELRTPIAGLRATTDLALSQPREAAAYATHLATCQRTAIELGDLVKRLSALARIGHAGTPALEETLDLGAILEDCLQSFLPRFDERRLKVDRKFTGGPLTATGDVTLLRIIFNNLLDNAISYTTQGSEIRIHGTANDGYLEIRIANQCNDLPENLERLFEPLFRRDPARNDTHLGIGLTLSFEAASTMDATLQVTKTHDGWIEFTVGIKSAPHSIQD